MESRCSHTSADFVLSSLNIKLTEAVLVIEDVLVAVIFLAQVDQVNLGMLTDIFREDCFVGYFLRVLPPPPYSLGIQDTGSKIGQQ